MDIKKDPEKATVSDDHVHDHVLTISGRKARYFAFLKALEDDATRTAFEDDPQELLKEHGIEFPDITSAVVKGNLPSKEHLHAYRTAWEEESAQHEKEGVMQSHAHLVWDLVVGQSALTRKLKSAH